MKVAYLVVIISVFSSHLSSAVGENYDEIILNLQQKILNLERRIKKATDELREMQIKIEALKIIETFEAKQTQSVTSDSQKWVDIPGAELKLSILRKVKARFRAYGTVRAKEGKNTYTHCGFRFVLDGKGLGDEKWGDRLVGCGKEGHPGWWCGWAIERHQELDSGEHTIKLQLTGWEDQRKENAKCILKLHDYSAARLFVDTFELNALQQ